MQHWYIRLALELAIKSADITFFEFFKYEPTKSSTLKTAMQKKIYLDTFSHFTIFDPYQGP